MVVVILFYSLDISAEHASTSRTLYTVLVPCSRSVAFVEEEEVKYSLEMKRKLFVQVVVMQDGDLDGRFPSLMEA